MGAEKDSMKTIRRPPVIVIMGHIDHGKSTLLDYIRKTNTVEGEAGGITQHIAGYEVRHKTKEGNEHLITFLDTPGHEAFSAIRARGAHVADIAVLVVSAEDGVKPQTIEALKNIREAKIPFIVAINKIDKPNANVEKTKQDLAEHNIFVEGYGGDVPVVAISAKTGENVSDLLDMMVLVAELEDLKGSSEKPAEGVVIESNVDTKKGISATLIIEDGTIKKGMFVVAGASSAPVRIMENFLGKKIDSASFSSPIKIIGWDKEPEVGMSFFSFLTKREAEKNILTEKEEKTPIANTKKKEGDDRIVIPLVVAADTAGSLEALKAEIGKIPQERVEVKIIQSSVGNISEKDIKTISGNEDGIVVGFHTGIDNPARSLADRLEIEVALFDIIYKLTEWLSEAVVKRTPSIDVEERSARAKILKVFSKAKNKQIIGGRVEEGNLRSGARVKISRRDFEIGQGTIRELQQAKEKTGEVPEGKEFGAMVEAKIDMIPGDSLETFRIVKK